MGLANNEAFRATLENFHSTFIIGSTCKQRVKIKEL